MSSGMPELGSKISLISKSDIRYEGRLYTIDPQQCTIALSSVRSFGTEDRDAQCPMPPQNQIYDYILFRGSDIKDIQVLSNVGNNVSHNVGPLPHDPAIVQLTLPPSLGSTGFQSQGFQHPVLGHMTPALADFQQNPYGTLGGLPSGVGASIVLHRDPRTIQKQSSELVGQPLVQETAPEQESDAVLDLIGGSRSETPSLMSGVTVGGPSSANSGPRKSPMTDQGTQVSQPSNNKDDKSKIPLPSRQQQQTHSGRDGRPQSRGSMNNYRDGPHGRSGEGNMQHRFAKWGNNGGNRTGQQNIGQGQRRGRGRGNQGNQGYGGNRQQDGIQQQPGQTKPKSGTTLKFDIDYDFEVANTQFEELRIQLSKVKIGSEPTTENEPKLNGENGDKKDDSGNETGAGEPDHEEEPEIFYDKAKSFFDNISCEAVERSKGRSQRTDWRTERKLNTETFGVSLARRGGYRGGRGYYANRGGGMYRGPGGGGGGWRSSNNYRGGPRGTGGNRQSQQFNQIGSGSSGLTSNSPLVVGGPQSNPLPQRTTGLLTQTS